MSPEFPRCAECRVSIEPGQSVVLRPDGRFHHVECPHVVCPLCGRDVHPREPIRRDGETQLHPNCWIKRYRASFRSGEGAS